MPPPALSAAGVRNPVLRFLFGYQHLNADRLGPMAPFGQIGQKAYIAAARAQFAF
ncbi:MAG: hypothetical protein ACYCZX_18185 [Rhodospirillaceae bacterium]